MDWVFNKKTGGSFSSLCDKECIDSIQSQLGSVKMCSNCGLMYSASEPHPLAIGAKKVKKGSE